MQIHLLIAIHFKCLQNKLLTQYTYDYNSTNTVTPPLIVTFIYAVQEIVLPTSTGTMSL